MMNNVKRQILPVGQGAFYLETLYKDGQQYKIVYDCGSATDINILTTQIQANFNRGEVIHAVFISHLDDDHVNGLEFLLNYCDVKHLFFPLITSETKELHEFRNLINPQSSFVNQFIYSNGQDIGGGELQLHPISEESNSEELISETSMAIFGTNISDWIYLPHNFRNDLKHKQLLSELANIDLQLTNSIFDDDDVDFDKLKQLWKSGSDNDKELIKSAYRKVPGKLNANSMTLYSGMKSSYYLNYGCDDYCCDKRFFGFYRRFYRRGAWNGFIYLKKNGCLYTGDYEAGEFDKGSKTFKTRKQKWESFVAIYQQYFKNVGLVQIPHHGSNYNYTDGFRTQIACATYFLSAGDKNNHGHPNKEVIVDLISNGSLLNIVTENIYSMRTYYSEWWS